MINLAFGVFRISNKCSCLEIFDQQESFKLDMIDLACGVVRISNKCSCVEIFDQQGNPNLSHLVVISLSFGIRPFLELIPYHWWSLIDILECKFWCVRSISLNEDLRGTWINKRNINELRPHSNDSERIRLLRKTEKNWKFVTLE